jgi:ABC-type polysaccharide/polyol phosphate transport system ATPase subunit
LAHAFISFIKRRPSRSHQFEAVKNVSFNVFDGDKIGILGRNGAGKSTLLKAIAGIYPPHRGKIVISGNTAALLEFGVGFDVNRTVRENIFLGGAIYGRSRAQMWSIADKIIDFAELNNFVNTPAKLLSSGMKSRLAFSIATSIEPEILILDEVFAAGDANFIKKAKKRMSELINSCRILMFVSHAEDLIKQFCNKGIVMEKGKIAMQGSTEEACNFYNSLVNNNIKN